MTFRQARSALGERFREEPGMAVEVTRGVGAAVGFVARRVDDLRPGCACPLIVPIHIS
jgi:hypothetical protein